jgi:hypothetical protein
MLTVRERKRKPLVNPLTNYRKKVRLCKSQALPTQTLGFDGPKLLNCCPFPTIEAALSRVVTDAYLFLLT